MMCAIQSVFSIHLENTLCGHTKKCFCFPVRLFPNVQQEDKQRERANLELYTKRQSQMGSCPLNKVTGYNLIMTTHSLNKVPKFLTVPLMKHGTVAESCQGGHIWTQLWKHCLALLMCPCSILDYLFNSMLWKLNFLKQSSLISLSQLRLFAWLVLITSLTVSGVLFKGLCHVAAIFNDPTITLVLWYTQDFKVNSMATRIWGPVPAKEAQTVTPPTSCLRADVRC